MEIEWLGHSALRIRSRGVTLITDPYSDSLGMSIGNPEADIVTISNPHPHHSNVSAIQGEPRVLEGPGEYEIGSYYITGLGTPLDDFEGEKQINTVFSIRAEGLTLCHLGDLAQRLTPGQMEELNQTDVLFAPGGAGCTIDAAGVSRLINVINPRIVVPIHYQIDGVNSELLPLDQLLAELAVTEATPQTRLNVTSTNLPGDLRVVILQRSQ